MTPSSLTQAEKLEKIAPLQKYYKGKEHHQYKHGMCRARPYRIWRSMINRCYRKEEASYPRYGAKGVTVCDEWRSDYQNFWKDMGPTYFDGATIDRIDNEKGYSPKNCRWATVTEQNRNKSSVRKFEYHGSMLTIPEIAELGQLDRRTVYARLVVYGWPVARCIHTPVKHGSAA